MYKKLVEYDYTRKQPILSDKTPYRCRFCEEIKGPDEFKEIAHAVAECIGNKEIISSANCKCKLNTCTVELSESERRSGWKPLAFILGDAAAAFGCVNRVEELVKQFLRSTVAQFLARPSV